MRTILKVVMPVDAGNKAINDGSLPATVQALIETYKPEASYFYAENGKRTMLFVFDKKDPTQISEIAEPLFMGLNADVQFYLVMNAGDRTTGLEKVAGRDHGRIAAAV